MKTFIIATNGETELYKANSAKEALESFEEDYTELYRPHWYGSTMWVTGSVVEEGSSETLEFFTLAFNPKEPSCLLADEHCWNEIPGSAVGNGGGVRVSYGCPYCDFIKKTNTWDQCPENGEQGFITVSYVKGYDNI
jgi:hypothetical protein